jgi:hypothetical protein
MVEKRGLAVSIFDMLPSSFCCFESFVDLFEARIDGDY